MTADLISGSVGVLLALGTVGGLAVRRRVGVCRTFIPYLVAVEAADVLMVLWPGYFYTQWFWVQSQTLINVLRFAVALELTYRTFRAFPGARGTARVVLFLVLAGTLLLVVAGTEDAAPVSGGDSLAPIISRVQPRIVNGTIWLLTAVGALILWYRLPVHPFHKAILTGLVPYLLVFTTALNLLETEGWQIRERVNYVHTGAYVALLGYWAWAAWHRPEGPVQAPEAESQLRHVHG